MIGTSLSRWTMAYFAAALVALVAAEALMSVGYGFPAAPIDAPATLLLVHLVALGWLSLLMSGALLQFVPVLVARPLFSERLPLPALFCLVLGLIALLCGFRQLGGEIAPGLPFLPAAAVLLGSGLALILWDLVATVWPARPLPLPARFVAVGLASVAATTILGIIFALVLSGMTSVNHLVQLTAAGVPIHAIAGLGGWLTFSAIGVSYRLLAMFTLAPDLDGPSPRATFWLGTVALALAVLGGTAAACLGFDTRPALVATAACGIAALAFYGFDVVMLFRTRKRRTLELNTRMAVAALVSLAAAAVLIVVSGLAGRLPQQAGAIAFLTAFGWLTGLGLAKLYKIVAFLTWLECYGPVMGKRPTPRVQDLVAEARAAKWFWLYFAAVWIATICLMTDAAFAFRGAAGAMTVATLGIVVELLRARRLADVDAGIRLPEGARRPRLLIAATQHP